MRAAGAAERAEDAGAGRRPALLSVVGARPNFMKLAPLARALRQRRDWQHRIVHTGQHYDENMSRVFFEELEIPAPEVHLGVGSGSHAQQTARVMLALEEVLQRQPPDLVVVVGDVNSTLAATLVACKLDIPVAHVEAGLRSFDRSMPEEINRLLTDQMATLLLTPSPDADANLRREGVAPERIHWVGNIMIDSLLHALPRAQATRAWERYGLAPEGYALVTMHRPANVDDKRMLQDLLQVLERLAARLPVLFPVHPRTRKMIEEFRLEPEQVQLVEPVGYLDFLALEAAARLVLTDSGGIQEETTVLRVPCLTLRPNTERPITVSQGTNHIVGRDPERIGAAAEAILKQPKPRGEAPEKWDGQTAERIVEVFDAFFAARA
ncbi:MAG TPA: UDP-N-acetylglucosamine 2-epimerase (non-hydrolyzing) [Candidatus Krumholzibacteria bacterium]|nr:UDP-N-acetylglucosamine 2-epimerase (non-hydrolyzing) [Candidatus Krumholzibacteria bacterium]